MITGKPKTVTRVGNLNFATMTTVQIINSVLAGGLLGMLGQGIRIAVGFKKLNDANNVQLAKGNPTENFSSNRMFISIFLGFAAGAIGMLIKGPTLGAGDDFSTESIVTIMAIGYSGADFIEGVFNTYINKPAGNTTTSENATNQINQQPAVAANNQPAALSVEEQLDEAIAG